MKEVHQLLPQQSCIPGLAFPDFSDSPAIPLEKLSIVHVTCAGRIELGLPKLRASLWHCCPPTIVPVPKAAMYEDDRLVPREDKVWPPWQATPM